jgi:hypothetical protein
LTGVSNAIRTAVQAVQVTAQGTFPEQIGKFVDPGFIFPEAIVEELSDLSGNHLGRNVKRETGDGRRETGAPLSERNQEIVPQVLRRRIISIGITHFQNPVPSFEKPPMKSDCW